MCWDDTTDKCTCLGFYSSFSSLRVGFKFLSIATRHPSCSLHIRTVQENKCSQGQLGVRDTIESVLSMTFVAYFTAYLDSGRL